MLDDLDRAILDVLQNHNKTSHAEIGEAAGLSAAAVQRRIKRLEQIGVIRSNVAVVDPVAVGAAVTVISRVEVNSESIELLDSLKKSFAAHPQVQQCYQLNEPFDFVLICVVATMDDYENLTQTLFFANPNVKRFFSHVAMDRVKVGLKVDLSRSHGESPGAC